MEHLADIEEIENYMVFTPTIPKHRILVGAIVGLRKNAISLDLVGPRYPAGADHHHAVL